MNTSRLREEPMGLPDRYSRTNVNPPDVPTHGNVQAAERQKHPCGNLDKRTRQVIIDPSKISSGVLRLYQFLKETKKKGTISGIHTTHHATDDRDDILHTWRIEHDFSTNFEARGTLQRTMHSAVAVRRNIALDLHPKKAPGYVRSRPVPTTNAAAAGMRYCHCGCSVCKHCHIRMELCQTLD